MKIKPNFEAIIPCPVCQTSFNSKVTKSYFKKYCSTDCQMTAQYVRQVFNALPDVTFDRLREIYEETS